MAGLAEEEEEDGQRAPGRSSTKRALWLQEKCRESVWAMNSSRLTKKCMRSSSTVFGTRCRKLEAMAGCSHASTHESVDSPIHRFTDSPIGNITFG